MPSRVEPCDDGEGVAEAIFGERDLLNLADPFSVPVQQMNPEGMK